VHEAVNLSLPWPLHLLGGGARPADTWISAPEGDAIDCALSFACSGKVAMLGIRCGSTSPAVIHVRGSLTLQHCLLVSEPRGLPHLVSPLLTLAVSVAGSQGQASSGGSSGPAAASEGDAAAAGGDAAAAGGGDEGSAAGDQETNTAAATSTSSRPLLGSRMPLVGSGRLQVVECQLMGGATAVRCAGTGRPANVRAIYESHSAAPYLWLDVDSAAGDAAAVTYTATAAAAGDWRAAGAASSACADAALQQRSKLWQQQRASDARCPAAGLARISAALQGINPANLTAHLQAREQQAQQAGA
jgi:hypothetical protein